MRNGASGAILYSALYVNEVSAALIAERKERAAAEHTVEKFTLHLVAGEVFAFLVFEIFTVVSHFAPHRVDLLYYIIIIHIEKCNSYIRFVNCYIGALMLK